MLNMSPKQVNEIIGEFSLKIHHLEKELQEYKYNATRVKRLLTCIGGPLNDNFHQYNVEQKKIFYQIENILNDLSYGDEEDD